MLAYGAYVAGREAGAAMGAGMWGLVRVFVVVVEGGWVELWVEVVVVEGVTTGGALVEVAVVVTAGMLVGLVSGGVGNGGGAR